MDAEKVSKESDIATESKNGNEEDVESEAQNSENVPCGGGTSEDLCVCVGGQRPKAKMVSIPDFNEVSLNILSVQLKDKVKKLTDVSERLPDSADFVCDCGKPLRESIFFPCVLQSYLSTIVDNKALGGLVSMFLNDYLIGGVFKKDTGSDLIGKNFNKNLSIECKNGDSEGLNNGVWGFKEIRDDKASHDDADEEMKSTVVEAEKKLRDSSSSSKVDRDGRESSGDEVAEADVGVKARCGKFEKRVKVVKEKTKREIWRGGGRTRRRRSSSIVRRFRGSIRAPEASEATARTHHPCGCVLSLCARLEDHLHRNLAESRYLITQLHESYQNNFPNCSSHKPSTADSSSNTQLLTENSPVDAAQTPEKPTKPLVEQIVNEITLQSLTEHHATNVNTLYKTLISKVTSQLQLGNATSKSEKCSNLDGNFNHTFKSTHSDCENNFDDSNLNVKVTNSFSQSDEELDDKSEKYDQLSLENTIYIQNNNDTFEYTRNIYINDPKEKPAKNLPNKSEVADGGNSSDETKELEEFERQERWASNEEYFSLNASLFANSSCQFNASDVVKFNRKDSDEHLECYDELLNESEDDAARDLNPDESNDGSDMRGEQPRAGSATLEKDVSKLKSSIKKMPRTKCKKNRVTFNENKNEFFEADYIILIREECQYDEESDEGICTCSQHEMVRLACCETDCNGYEREAASCQPPGEFVDQVTLSPPEGYKDSGLFNQDGTFKDQSFFAREGPGLLVSEASGAVFTPQHLRQLQVIQRLQREQLRRARASLTVEDGRIVEASQTGTTTDDLGHENNEEQHPEGTPVDPAFQERPFSEKDRSKGFYAKEIVAGEERPKVNSGQQTTPTDEEVQYGGEALPTRSPSEGRLVRDISSSSNNDETDSQAERHDPPPVDSSPIRLGGILKGGRLWKPLEGGTKVDAQQQAEAEESGNYSNPASDEEGRAGRAVRFSEPPPREPFDPNAPPDAQNVTAEDTPKTQHLALTFRLGNHLLSNNSLRPNSAVRQLFPAGPHLVAPPQRTEDDKRYLVTTESLRAFEEAKRSRLPSSYREDDLTIRRNIDRNTLRRSLVKVDPRKKTLPKNDTSLTERIKMLTCNIEDDENEQDAETETEHISPSGDEPRQVIPPSAKSFSPSSSSSASSCSSTSSTYKKLTEIFPKRQECISECNEEGSNVVIIPQNEKGVSPMSADIVDGRRQYLPKMIQCSNRSGERLSLSSTGTDFSLTDLEASLEMPAPDVLAGTPGAGDGDELARFVQQDAARTERLRRRYQQSAENSDEDDQDDYGFQRRPSVRGIKPRFGSTNEILQQMQAQLQMGGITTPTTRPGHVSWPYYSESNLTQPAQHDHALHNPDGMHNSRSSTEDFQQNVKMGSSAELSNQVSRDCYDLRNHNIPDHHQHAEHLQHLQHVQHKRIHDDTIYQNCVTYANIRCSVGDRDLYSSQSSLVPVGSMAHMAQNYDNQQRTHRRPESPPPIRSYHQTMVLIPYSNLHQPHYSNTIDRNYPHSHAMSAEQNGSHSGYQHQNVGDQATLLKISQAPQQLVGIPFAQPGVPMQITCSAPAAHIRTIPSRPVARHMICYSEKVEAPMYQAAPGSPVAVRGAPEGAPAPAASPTAPHTYPPHNSLYYAMNV